MTSPAHHQPMHVPKRQIIIATCAELFPPGQEDDLLLADALRRHGFDVRMSAWNHPDTNWVEANTCVIRSTWDYMNTPSQYFRWCESVAAASRLVNPIALVRWNLDKRYLQDLAQRGVRVVDSVFCERGSSVRLDAVLRERGWAEAIIKPVVSATAMHTHRVDGDSLATASSVFDELLAERHMIIQPFLARVLSDGELSLIYLDGEFSHAVVKRARPDDFRVQDDFGGTFERVTAADEEIRFGLEAVRACPELPVYARVDTVRDRQGRLNLMELELVEPDLFLRLQAGSAERLARSIPGE